MRAVFLLTAILSTPGLAAVPCTKTIGQRNEPCQPRVAERQRLLVLIREANDEFDLYAKAKSKEHDLRGSIGLSDIGDLNEWKDNRNEMGIRLRRAQTAFEEAARLTGLYYGVAPAATKGNVAGGAAWGARAEWKPRLQGEEDEVFEVKRRGQSFFQKYESNDLGDPKDPSDDRPIQSTPLDDGTVLISVRLLKDSLSANNNAGDPVVLATQLQLERTRFEAKTCFDGERPCSFRKRRHLFSDSVEHRAVLDVLATADQMGLPPGLQQDLAIRKAELENSLRRPRTGKPSSFLSPEESATNQMDWSATQERLRFIKAQRIRLNARLAAQQRGETLPPSELRDALTDPTNGGAPEETDACGQRGLWSGDVFFPPMPCPQELANPSSSPPAIPAVIQRPVPAVTLPAPVRAIPSLSGLAERICANPTGTHTQPFHDDYKAAWYGSNEDGASMPNCQREIFLALKKLRQEGYSDYNSAYFQALAENMNMPQPRAFEPPLPEVDLPAPPGPGVRDCMRADGRRCIRWR